MPWEIASATPAGEGSDRHAFLFSIYDFAIAFVSKIYVGVPNFVAAAGATFVGFLPPMIVCDDRETRRLRTCVGSNSIHRFSASNATLRR
jgi:hypothetical protein